MMSRPIIGVSRLGYVWPLCSSTIAGGIFGVVRRGEADEQRVVAQLEGQRGVLEHARGPLRHGDAADLRGTGLCRPG